MPTHAKPIAELSAWMRSMCGVRADSSVGASELSAWNRRICGNGADRWGVG